MTPCAERARLRSPTSPGSSTTRSHPPRSLVEDLEADTAAHAFATLPESWQKVLWHVEVEGRKPGEVADLLGMRAGAVSSLAHRAREGLRRAYLDQHVVASAAPAECRWTRDRLSQYVRTDLSSRAEEKVSAHLGSCEDCLAAYLQVERVNRKARRLDLPGRAARCAARLRQGPGLAGRPDRCGRCRHRRRCLLVRRRCRGRRGRFGRHHHRRRGGGRRGRGRRADLGGQRQRRRADRRRGRQHHRCRAHDGRCREHHAGPAARAAPGEPVRAAGERRGAAPGVPERPAAVRRRRHRARHAGRARSRRPRRAAPSRTPRRASTPPGPIAVTAVAPTEHPITSCETYGSIDLPTTRGVSYRRTAGDGRTGAWAVEASAQPGYVLKPGTQQTFTGTLGTWEHCVRLVSVEARQAGLLQPWSVEVVPAVDGGPARTITARVQFTDGLIVLDTYQVDGAGWTCTSGSAITCTFDYAGTAPPPLTVWVQSLLPPGGTVTLLAGGETVGSKAFQG
ncbi:sigma-70 family RNA polymerase sigma factor [Nocardioides sp. W3-2-3]|uniref:zf-HC2 domain-containing protein n=1 Tax=Nocardioides convexus TaxID=2712224 RepID=UPI0024188E01|nr:sigma-70 family RNA polymerase sigma factor [Nocardioides convexus]NHA01307.1 sigma-70 family RNA polymerase sigma factor [Nocardioides convexus]